MIDKLWAELSQARFNLEFCSIYSERQRFRSKLFTILILIFSTGGVMGWKIWDDIPAVACIIISGLSIFKLIQPQIIMTDKQISSLDTLHMFYVSYYSKLEQLWYEVDLHELTDNEIYERLYELKKEEMPMLQKVNELDLRKPKSIIKAAELETNLYLTIHFKLNNNEQRSES